MKSFKRRSSIIQLVFEEVTPAARQRLVLMEHLGLGMVWWKRPSLRPKVPFLKPKRLQRQSSEGPGSSLPPESHAKGLRSSHSPSLGWQACLALYLGRFILQQTFSSSMSSFLTSLSLGFVSVLSVFVILIIASFRPCLLSSSSLGKRPDGNCSQVSATLGTQRVLERLSTWARVHVCACVRTCPQEGRRL